MGVLSFSPLKVASMGAVLGVVLLAVFWDFWKAQFFFAVTFPSDWGHTLLIPVISGWMIWLKREELRSAQPFSPLLVWSSCNRFWAPFLSACTCRTQLVCGPPQCSCAGRGLHDLWSCDHADGLACIFRSSGFRWCTWSSSSRPIPSAYSML